MIEQELQRKIGVKLSQEQRFDRDGITVHALPACLKMLSFNAPQNWATLKRIKAPDSRPESFSFIPHVCLVIHCKHNTYT